jgi:Cold shock proteins
MSLSAFGGKDVFVCFGVIQGSGRKSLKEGLRVAMEVTSGSKGPQAENVTPFILVEAVAQQGVKPNPS